MFSDIIFKEFDVGKYSECFQILCLFKEFDVGKYLECFQTSYSKNLTSGSILDISDVMFKEFDVGKCLEASRTFPDVKFFKNDV